MSSFTQVMIERVKAQEPKAPALRNGPIFLRKLEERLDERRRDNRLMMMNVPRDTADFSSNDFLSISSSGLLKEEFFEELRRHPNFLLGSSGSRLVDGNNVYIETLERDFASFLGADTSLVFGSGYEANHAIFSVLPQPGDAIVYDELVHASIIDGMASSRATNRRSFRHNNVEDFRAVMNEVKRSDENLSAGRSCVIVAIESVYSMDGDVSPVEELLAIAQEIFPLGNAQFFFDEAHSTGLMGPNGRGMAIALGIEKQLAVRLHTFGKGMGCNGALVLGSETVRNMLINFARGLIFTAAPSFPFLAAMRAGYNILKEGKAEPLRQKLQDNLRYFYKNIFSASVWEPAKAAGIFDIPEARDWEKQEVLLQIVPIWTNARDNRHLAAHLHLANYRAFPVDYPVVPKGQGRLRLVFHAGNSFEQIDAVVKIICEWAQEVLDNRQDNKPMTCVWAKLVQVEEARKAKAVKLEQTKSERQQLIVEAKAYQESSML